MSLEQLRELLEGTEFPAAYRAWPIKKAPPMPYLCYLVAYSNNFAADGQVYHPIDHIQVELYTRQKNSSAEEKVETVLSGMYWEKTETYIETEHCFQIVYEIEV